MNRWNLQNTAEQSAVFSFTERGKALADRIASLPEFAGALRFHRESGAEIIRTCFSFCRCLIFVGASGIAVRLISPFVRDKYKDPAVLSVDEAGRFAVPLLSGHLGGANRLAMLLANRIGAVPVISTATDLNEKFAVDVWAADLGLAIGNRNAAKEVSAALLRGETVGFFSEIPVEGVIPEGMKQLKELPRIGEGTERIRTAESSSEQKADRPDGGHPWILAAVVYRSDTLSHLSETFPGDRLLPLFPPCLCLGIGCRRGADPDHTAEQAEDFLLRHGVRREAVSAVATIDIKKEEPAVKALAERFGAELFCFPPKELKSAPGDFPESPFVREITGVGNVCQRAASLVFPTILVPKEKGESVTFALSFGAPELSFPAASGKKRCRAFVTGGAFQGKTAFAKTLSGSEDPVVIRAETLWGERQERDPGEIERMAEETAETLLKEYPGAVFVLQSAGSGLVPADPKERALREFSGRLSIRLAAQAEAVYEVVAGIPRRLA